MMVRCCRKCNAPVGKKVSFCTKCGNRLIDAEILNKRFNKKIILSAGLILLLAMLNMSWLISLKFNDPVAIGSLSYSMGMGGGFWFVGERHNAGDEFTKYRKTGGGSGRGVCVFGNNEEPLYIHYDAWNKYSRCFIGGERIEECAETEVYDGAKIFFVDSNKALKIYLFQGDGVFWIIGKDDKGVFNKYVDSINLIKKNKEVFSKYPHGSRMLEWSFQFGNVRVEDDTIIVPFSCHGENQLRGAIILDWNNKNQDFEIEIVEVENL